MKKYKSNLIILTLLIVVFFSATIVSAQRKPIWISERPVQNDFYIGIGAADKDDGNLDYRQIAKENALQDLSSEITINISSQVVVSMMETSDAFEEELKSRIQSTTQANLEGYELVDNWEDENQYWVYYRLSKTLYTKNRNARIEKATSLGLNMFTQAKAKENDRDPAAALQLYIQAMQTIEEFISEPIKTEYAGSTIYLQNELFNSVQTILSNITLKAEAGQVDGTVGRALQNPITIEAIYVDGTLIANLPLTLKFVKGKGELISEIRTGANGLANSRVTNISSTINLQIINAKVMIVSEVTRNEYPLIHRILNDMNVPSTRIIINVAGITCFMEASETIMGSKPEINYVEPKLKKVLTDKGFSFSESVADADVLIKVEVVARKGAQVYNLFSSFADLSISVTNLGSGQEVYKNSFSGIKGIQLDYEKAGIEALKNAGKKIDEIASELISKLR